MGRRRRTKRSEGEQERRRITREREGTIQTKMSPAGWVRTKWSKGD